MLLFTCSLYLIKRREKENLLPLREKHRDGERQRESNRERETGRGKHGLRIRDKETEG